MQMDYITPARHMEEQGDGPSVMPMGRERKGSWGEAILTGGAAVDSINSYLQALAEKADQKRKEHKKKRKERKALKDKKHRRKRSRSQDEGSAKAAQDDRTANPGSQADQPRQTATAAPTATAAVTHHQHQHQHAHQNQQALHPMTINLVAPTMPTNLATRRDHQPQHPHDHHLVHSASYPNFPVGQAHHLHQPQRSHPMPAANSTSTTSPMMMMAGAGEFFASHAVSMSMPTLPTLSSSSLLLNEPYATSTSTTSGGWHDAGSQWVDAGVPLQRPQPQHTMNAAFPPQPQHQMQMQGSGPAFDDSFLSSFLSSDILQAEEVALLTDLL